MFLSFALLFIAALSGLKLTEFYGIPFTDIHGQIQQQRYEAFRNLSLVADIEKEYLLSWIHDRLADAHIIVDNDLFKSNLSQLHRTVEPFLNTTKSEELLDKVSSVQRYGAIQDILKTMQSERGVYEYLSIADAATGIIFVSTNESDIGVNVSEQDFFLKPLVYGSHYTSDIKIDTQSGKPVFYISHIVTENGTKISEEDTDRDLAVLILQIDAERVILPMLDVRKGLGKTGEALLLNRDARIITSLKHPLADGSIAKPMETQINAKPAVLAVSGQEGIIEADDYRNVPVLAAFRYIRISSDLGWGMVVKRDQAEVFSYLNKTKYYSALTALISIAVLSVLVLVIANNLSKPIRALSAAAQSVTGGDLNARADVKSSDETGMLASSFNSMVDQLQNWHTDLEKQVYERTAELNNKNIQLESSNQQLAANEQQLRAANQQLTASDQQLRAGDQQLRAGEQQLRASNQQLRASEHLLQTSIDQMPAAYILWDRDFRALEWNKAAEQIFGYTREETLGKSLTELIVPEPVRHLVNEVLEKLHKGESVHYSEKDNNIRKDGTLISCQWHNTPLVDNNGNIIAILSIAEDITKRKQTEENLLRYACIVSNSTDMMAMLDTNFVYLSANKAYLSAFDMTEDRVIGRTVSQVFGEEIFETTIKPNAQRCMEGTEVRYEEWFQFPVHGSRFMLVNYSPFISTDGDIKGFVVNAKDITYLKQAEGEREKLLKKLELKNDELQSIVYISSHDLKTPLVNINGFSHLLKEHSGLLKNLIEKQNFSDEVKKEITSLIDKDIHQDLDIIGTSTYRIERLINGLSRVSRIGISEVNFRKIDMNKMASEILAIVKYLIDENNTEVNIAELPSCKADEDMIRQVFTNLVDNAIKYLNPKQKGLINITGYTKDDRSIYCVEDNGIGIRKDYHDKVFDIYYRLDPKSPVEGEGLGLTIIRRILDRHDGNIWVESEENKGSKFFVSLQYGD